MMDASLFISRRLRFKAGLVMTSVAVSFLVMIIAVAVSSGFRSEIRGGLSSITGDVQILPPDLNILDQSRPIEKDASYLPHLMQVEGVRDIVPAVYATGIVKQGTDIYGVLFKGIESGLEGVSIPAGFAELAGMKQGDRMTAYFIGDKVRARQFNISSVYEASLAPDDKVIVYADMEVLQRLCGWSEDKVSAIEITLDDSHKDEDSILEATQEIGAVVNAWSEDSQAPVVAVSSVSRFSQLFDWLGLIDFNVLFILALMTVVAGFNMVSGLLIMLFENISTIGLLKALGMNDRAVSKIFLVNASVLVLKGMFIGNVLAMIFCLVQDKTHLLKLDPDNYFVSHVPVNVDWGTVLLADAGSFVVIMLFLLIPTLFISRIDPAQTVRVK